VEVVVLRIQPNPAIIYYYDRTRIKALLEWSKSNTSKIVSVPLEYKKTTFPNFTEDAYSKLLCHVLNGNKEQFVHNDELEMSWKIVTPILEPRECEIQQYEQGSCGPPGRMEFLERAEIPNAACSVDINNAGTVYLQSSL
jgi:glucose-6-phosphate 1-dehydrogenase